MASPEAEAGGAKRAEVAVLHTEATSEEGMTIVSMNSGVEVAQIEGQLLWSEPCAPPGG